MTIAKKFSTMTCAAVALAMTTASVGATPFKCGGYEVRSDTVTTAPDFRRSNVPTCDGRYVSGFQIIGSGVQWFTTADNADECFDVDVTVLPDGFDIFDNDSVSEYLGIGDIDFYRRTFTACKVV